MTMTTLTAAHRNKTSPFSMSPERRSVLIAIAVFLGLLGIVDIVSTGPLSYFDISFLSSGGATSAIAAIGQTIVVLSGGFDLSAGAVISLVNVVLAQSMDPMAAQTSIFYWTCVGIGVGMLTGAFNGFFIAFFRLQPIVVTLSTMFIIQGLTLLVMDKPGGFVAPDLGTFYLGDAVPGWLPMPLVVIGVVLLAWLWLKNTRFGTAIYAVGSDPDAAAAIGIRVKLTKFFVYVLAGGCYGLAGVFISAQTGSADPLVGNPLAPFDVCSGCRRRHTSWRRAWRPLRHGIRRLYPHDGREHSARSQCIGLLFDHCRRNDPDPRRLGGIDFIQLDACQATAQCARAVRGLAERSAAIAA